MVLASLRLKDRRQVFAHTTVVEGLAVVGLDYVAKVVDTSRPTKSWKALRIVTDAAWKETVLRRHAARVGSNIGSCGGDESK